MMKTCILCGATFDDPRSIKRHEKWHNPIITFRAKNRILNKTGDNIWLD
jgi:hypothetical protein